MNRWVAGVCISVLSLMAGCRSKSGHLTPQELAEQGAELDDERSQLQQIPTPTKSRYMAVHSFDSWQNPYLTVQANMVELHVTRGDVNPSSFGAGGMLRPIGARREVLDIGMDKLGEAMSSIPADAWPYGRVVAIEEAHHTPANAEPAVRRNEEVTVSKLNDLGIVVYDLADGRQQ